MEKRIPAEFRQENKKSFRVYLTQAEGLIMGIGGKLFTVAGPVLVYGISSSIIVGIIYWIAGLIAGGR